MRELVARVVSLETTGNHLVCTWGLCSALLSSLVDEL